MKQHYVDRSKWHKLSRQNRKKLLNIVRVVISVKETIYINFLLYLSNLCSVDIYANINYKV